MKRKNIFFYSNDFHGMGHFTRNYRIVLFLAKRLANHHFYLITNKSILDRPFLKNMHLILLPPLSVNRRPRNCRYLEETITETHIWSDFLMSLLDKYNPEVFYSDLNPNGGYGEFRNVFHEFKKRGIQTIIGLRDILDGLAQTKKEWLNKNYNMLNIYDYDKIIVFGEKRIFEKFYEKIIDCSKISFVGYVFPEKDETKKKKTIDLFAMFGGGGRSKEQIMYVSDLLHKINKKNMLVVTGPLFPEDEFEMIKKKYSNITFIKKTNNVMDYLKKSRKVITHCGYNSIMEALTFADNVVLFPRINNTRKEQIWRAKIFKKFGYCDYISTNLSKRENMTIIEKENDGRIHQKDGLNQELINVVIK